MPLARNPSGWCIRYHGVHSFVFIRQSLQLHANLHLRERKLPSLRSYSEKYLKLISDLARRMVSVGHGRSLGAYGQMHCISLALQALRDGWVSSDNVTSTLMQFAASS